MADRIGSYFSSIAYEADLEALIRKWINTYLAGVEDDIDLARGTISRPKGYKLTADAEKKPEEQTPLVVIESDGLSDLTRSPGQYGGTWNWTIQVLTSTNSEETARKTAQAYGAALRSLVLQKHGSLNGVASAVAFEGEGYGVGTSEDMSRTLAVVTLAFSTTLPQIVSLTPGPSVPIEQNDQGAPDPIDAPEPRVLHTHINVTKGPLHG